MSIARILIGVGIAAVGFSAGWQLQKALSEKKKEQQPKDSSPNPEVKRASKRTENKEVAEVFAKFNEIFDGLVKNGCEVAYKKEWANNTGYFNGVLEDVFIPGWAVSTDPHGRRMIIHADHERGNVVVFQRYSEEDLLAYNAAFDTGFDTPFSMSSLEKFAKNNY